MSSYKTRCEAAESLSSFDLSSSDDVSWLEALESVTEAAVEERQINKEFMKPPNWTLIANCTTSKVPKYWSSYCGIEVQAKYARSNLTMIWEISQRS